MCKGFAMFVRRCSTRARHRGTRIAAPLASFFCSYTVKRFVFAQRCDRILALIFSATETVPKLNSIFSESSRPGLSKSFLSDSGNLPVVEKSNAEKRSHLCAKPKRCTVHGVPRTICVDSTHETSSGIYSYG